MKRIVTISLSLIYCGVLLTGLAFQPAPIAAQTAAGDIPLPARVVLSKAGALIKANKYDQAIAELTAFQDRGKALTSADPADPKGYRHPEIAFALGSCYLLKQDYGAAARVFETVVRQAPSHVGAWLNLAKAAYELKDYPRAARAFRQAYDRAEEKKPEYLYYSAVAYQTASRMAPCLTAYKELFAAHGSAVEPAWRENYVHALLAADKPRLALPHIRQLAEQYTGDKQVQWQEILLNQYLQLNLQSQARDYALELTRRDPLRPKWWQCLTHVDLNAGRYEQALMAMTVYGYLTPLSAQETKLLADLNLQVGIPFKAVPLYERALGQNGDDRLVRSLTLALQQLGRTQEALETLDRFTAHGRHADTDLVMLRADLLYTLKRYAEAVPAYRQAAKVDSSKAGRAWLMAGYAALQNDDAAVSRQAFQKAATFERQRKAALLALAQLPKAEPKGTDKRSRL